MIDRAHISVAGRYAEGRALDSLEFLNKGWCGVDEPNGSCMYEKGPFSYMQGTHR